MNESDKAAHTPGPWRVIPYDAGDVDHLSGMPAVVASEELDCSIVHWDGFVQRYWRSARGDAEIHANARLIAAAPDLLEALKGAIGALEFSRDYHSDLGNEEQAFCQDKLDAAVSAIARAEGRDQ